MSEEKTTHIPAPPPALPADPVAGLDVPQKTQASAGLMPEPTVPKKERGPKYSPQMAAYFKALRDELDTAMEMAALKRGEIGFNSLLLSMTFLRFRTVRLFRENGCPTRTRT